MSTQDLLNPEESWAEMIREFGDDHGPLGPKLSKALREDPYSLMWHVSWFKFAGKMIGTRERTLVFDFLEGLGGWTVACETGKVVTVLDADDSYAEIRAAWPDEKIMFEKSEEGVLSSESEFGGFVYFDAHGSKGQEGWEKIFEDGSRILTEGGVMIAGGRNPELVDLLKKLASKHFKHVFMFGYGQPHPCISPADTVVVMAC